MPPQTCNTLAQHSHPCLGTCVEYDLVIRMCRSVSVRGRFELLYCMNTLGLKIAMTCYAFDMCLFLVELCLVYLSSVSSIIDKARLQLSRVTEHMVSSVTSLITHSVGGAEHHGTCSHYIIQCASLYY